MQFFLAILDTVRCVTYTLYWLYGWVPVPPYTVHIMAYNFYVDNVLFHYRQWVWILSRLYVTFILLRCYLVLCRNFNYFLVTSLLVVVFLATL